MEDRADETLSPPAETPETAATGTLAPRTLLAGRYRVLRLVGRGGMGEVYAAEDALLGTVVALKILRPELAGSTQALGRFRREMALARKVTNVHVCRVHDLGDHEGRAFLTMELLEGETLGDRLRERSALPLDELDAIAAQLVDGLAALHAAGVVHRDFKPSNIMLAGSGRGAVITDFGLARSTETSDATVTAEATLLGTPAYMAPEQVTGQPATPATDVYALGITLFEAATGQPPFRDTTALATAIMRVHRDPPRPSSLRPDLPVRWDAIVERCLAREPQQRAALTEVLAAPLRSARRSRRWLVAPLLLAVLAIAAAIWRVSSSHADAPFAIGDADRVALVPAPGGADLLDDPWALALTVDVQDELTTVGLPMVTYDFGAYYEELRGTGATLAREARPAEAAWRIDNMAAVSELAIVHRPDAGDDRLAVELAIERRADERVTQRFERPSADATQLAHDLAVAIATELGRTAPPRRADVGTRDGAMYAEYGAALGVLFRRTRGAVASAALETLVSKHPDFHRAGVRLGLWWLETALHREDGTIMKNRERAAAIAERILAADRDHPLALCLRGVVALVGYDWATADATFARALELAPTHHRIQAERAYQLMDQGRYDEYWRITDRMLALDPLGDHARLLAFSYVYSRRYADAVRVLPAAIERADKRARVDLRLFLAIAYGELARFDEALAVADLIEDGDDPYLRASLVPIYAAAGRPEKARAMRAEIGDRAGTEAGALMDDALGNIDAALAGLEATVALHHVEALFLKVERFSPTLRAQPRFQALMHTVGFTP